MQTNIKIIIIYIIIISSVLFQEMFFIQILISIIVNWAICAILTSADVLTDDPTNPEYNARTDARNQIIQDNPWFTFPYPGT